MLELHGIYWFPDNDLGITDIADPFSNLLNETMLPRLLRDFETWQLDMRLCSLREGKMLGTNKAQTGTRDSIMRSRLQASPNYRRNLKAQQVKGETAFNDLYQEAFDALEAQLERYRNKEISMRDLKSFSHDFFAHFYSRVWEAGRTASGIELYAPDLTSTPAEKKWLDSAVQEELGYWDNFLRELEADQVYFATDQPDGFQRYTVEERLTMYLVGLEGIFESGRVAGMPDNRLFYWIGPKKTDRGICRSCLYIIEHQPFTKSTLPAVPRTGSTLCLQNCRHKLLVRSASIAEVQARDKVLPKRGMMVQQLQSIQKSI